VRPFNYCVYVLGTHLGLDWLHNAVKAIKLWGGPLRLWYLCPFEWKVCLFCSHMSIWLNKILYRKLLYMLYFISLNCKLLPFQLICSCIMNSLNVFAFPVSLHVFPDQLLTLLFCGWPALWQIPRRACICIWTTSLCGLCNSGSMFTFCHYVRVNWDLSCYLWNFWDD
jgi:hypothetical protein